MKKENKENGQL